jgi:hypothetical protein
MDLAGISMFCTVIVLSIHHGPPRPVPRLLRIVVHDFIARMLCVKQRRRHGRVDDVSTDWKQANRDHECSWKVADNDNNVKNTAAAEVASQHSDEEIREEWMETARIVDRFFLFVFALVILIMTASMLGIMIGRSPRRVEPITVAINSSQ